MTSEWVVFYPDGTTKEFNSAMAIPPLPIGTFACFMPHGTWYDCYMQVVWLSNVPASLRALQLLLT